MEKHNFIKGKELALAAARFADDKKAEAIVVLDLRGISSVADFFVICTGSSSPHLKAIYREVGEKLAADHGVVARGRDGNPESQWLVLDYVDVIVHVLHHDQRDNYALEDLWSDAKQVRFDSLHEV
ncbi:MAG: ribosome silencing factor [Verrucomicrobiaceae bacterium]|nr:ribosome silencing factor [Verrucomicrobiaceae bacterium]